MARPMRSAPNLTTAAALILGLFAGVAHAAAPKAEEAPAGDDITWRLAGPGGGGWIQAMACDPKDPDILYVGCDVGGFYFSSDGGRNYEIRNTGLRNYFVESVAVHPEDSRIILLGTEGGIFRTADQGKAWEWVRAGFAPVTRWSFSAPVSAVCFDPQSPNVVYAGIGRPRQSREGQGAIYRSDDTGRTWRNVSAGQLPPDAIVSDVALKPGESRVVLAATHRGVFRSEDAGKTWRPSSDGLPHLHVAELAFAHSLPDVVYASIRTTARDEEPWDGGVFRSDDAGRTWRSVNGSGMPTVVGSANQPGPMTSGIREIVVDPRNADVVYAGSTAWVTDGVYKTTDGGRTWQRIMTRDMETVGYGWITQWGPGVQCMAVAQPDPDRIAFGTSGHVFVTEDGGGTWQQRYCKQLPDGRFAGNGLEVTCLNKVLPDPVRTQHVYFCYMDIGLLVSDDNGRTFRRSFKGMRHDGNCFTVLVDPKAPSTMWAGTGQWASNDGDVCRSDDGGETWQVVGRPESGLPNGQTRHLVLDPRSPVGKRRLVVTSAGNGIYESRDGGISWQCISGGLNVGAVGSPRGLIMDPVDADHMIVALGGTPGSGAGVYETHDGGVSWQRVNDEPIFADITSLAADPRQFATVYLGTRSHYDHPTKRSYPGGAFKSADGGRTWQHILDYHFVSAVAVSPAASDVVYAATNDHPYHDDCAANGILKSADGGATWRTENTGLSLLNFNCISVNPHDPSVVYAGTMGNSAFVGKDAAVARSAGQPRAPVPIIRAD